MRKWMEDKICETEEVQEDEEGKCMHDEVSDGINVLSFSCFSKHGWQKKLIVSVIIIILFNFLWIRVVGRDRMRLENKYITRHNVYKAVWQPRKKNAHVVGREI
jgi:hypothetical protein